MDSITNKPLSEQIQWIFTLATQGQQTRFGKLGLHYYKQYLPLGEVNNQTHPPTRVEKRLYELAASFKNPPHSPAHIK